MAFKSDQAQGKDQREVEASIVEFEKKLDRLKTLYEQYFMGIEKREPSVPLKDVVRVMRALEQEEIRNTGLRFRYRTLVQRFNTYRTYWHRTLREIERGTYHRDLARLRRNLARQGIDMPKVGKLRSVADVERAMSDAAQKSHETAKEDTDRMVIPAGVRGASAEDLRRKVEPRPEEALGPIDLDQEDEEKTDRHLGASARSGVMQAPPGASARSGVMQAPPEASTRSGVMQAPPEASTRSGVMQAPPEASTRSGVMQAPPRSGVMQAPPRSGVMQAPPRSGVMQAPPGDLPPAPRVPSSPDIRPPGRAPSAVGMPTGRQPSGVWPGERRPSSPGMPPDRPPSSPGMQQPPGRTRSSPGMRPPAGRAPSSPNIRAKKVGPSEAEISSLYQRFVRAKELCGEDTSSVRIDSLRRSIEHQMPKIQQMYQGRDVEFQVVIRSGRAILKAKPK